MLLIPCPWCGPRPHVEFSYVGDATVRRPDDALNVPMDEWHAYVYERDNPKGAHTELWQHGAGCRAFIRVQRDTVSHAISGAQPVGDAHGDGAGGDEDSGDPGRGDPA